MFASEDARKYYEQISNLRKSKTRTLDLLESLYDRQVLKQNNWAFRDDENRRGDSDHVKTSAQGEGVGPSTAHFCSSSVPFSTEGDDNGHGSKGCCVYATRAGDAKYLAIHANATPHVPVSDLHRPTCEPRVVEDPLLRRTHNVIANMWQGVNVSEEAADDSDVESDMLDPIPEPPKPQRIIPPPRVATVGQNRSTKGAVDYAVEKMKRAQEEERHLSTKFRAAAPAPDILHNQQFGRMSREWRARKNQFATNRQLHRLNADRKRHEDEEAQRREKADKEKAERNALSRQFKARPIPPGVIDDTGADRIQEREYYRNLKMHMSSELLLAQAKAPGRMEERIAAFTAKKAKERKASEQTKKLNGRRQNATVVQPFQLTSTEKRSKKTRNEILKEMEEDRERLPETRWPFLPKESPMGTVGKKQKSSRSQKETVTASSPLHRPGRDAKKGGPKREAVPDSPPRIRHTRSSKLRQDKVLGDIERKEEETMRAEERQNMLRETVPDKLINQVRAQVRRNDTAPQMQAQLRANRMLFQESQQLLDVMYGDHLASIQKKVARAPTLMERATKTQKQTTDTRNVSSKKAHEIRRQKGATDDVFVVPFAPSERRKYMKNLRLDFHEDDFASLIASSSAEHTGSISVEQQDSDGSTAALLRGGSLTKANRKLQSTTTYSSTNNGNDDSDNDSEDYDEYDEYGVHPKRGSARYAPLSFDGDGSDDDDDGDLLLHHLSASQVVQSRSHENKHRSKVGVASDARGTGRFARAGGTFGSPSLYHRDTRVGGLDYATNTPANVASLETAINDLAFDSNATGTEDNHGGSLELALQRAIEDLENESPMLMSKILATPAVNAAEPRRASRASRNSRRTVRVHSTVDSTGEGCVPLSLNAATPSQTSLTSAFSSSTTSYSSLLARKVPGEGDEEDDEEDAPQPRTGMPKPTAAFEATHFHQHEHHHHRYNNAAKRAQQRPRGMARVPSLYNGTFLRWEDVSASSPESSDIHVSFCK